jgi:hypothetical protein
MSIIILWDHHRICGPLLTETLLCGAWLYMAHTLLSFVPISLYARALWKRSVWSGVWKPVSWMSPYVSYNKDACFTKYDQSCLKCLCLTFKNHASYIQDGRTATLQVLHFIYIFSTNINNEYFKHAAHYPFFSSKCCLFPFFSSKCCLFPFFSSKCRLFRNATFFWFLCYSHFTYRCVLKFKCKIRVPKG